MSITKSVTIWCDGEEDHGFECGEWEHAGGMTATELRKELKRQGWKHVNGHDYCPKCIKKINRF